MKSRRGSVLLADKLFKKSDFIPDCHLRTAHHGQNRSSDSFSRSELVITILISNIATLPIENSDVPLILGIVPILTLMCFEVILSVCALKNLKLRRLIWGNTRVVIQDGKLDQQELADLRYSVDDLMEQLRINGIFDLREVDYAVAETTGQLSVRKKAQYETLNAQTLQIQLTPQPVPVLVINDRKILDQGLKACGLAKVHLKRY